MINTTKVKMAYGNFFYVKTHDGLDKKRDEATRIMLQNSVQNAFDLRAKNY